MILDRAMIAEGLWGIFCALITGWFILSRNSSFYKMIRWTLVKTAISSSGMWLWALSAYTFFITHSDGKLLILQQLEKCKDVMSCDFHPQEYLGPSRGTHAIQFSVHFSFILGHINVLDINPTYHSHAVWKYNRDYFCDSANGRQWNLVALDVAHKN